MTSKTFTSAKSLSEAFDALDNDPDIGFVFIPLQKNESLEKIIKNIETQKLTARLSPIYNDVSSEEFYGLFPKASSFLTLKESDGKFLLDTNKEAILNSKSGQSVDLSIPEGLHIYNAAVKHNNGKLAFSKERHKDPLSTFTVNLYGKGRGLRYFMNDQVMSIPSPAITIHRGEQHPLGPEAAIDHQGSIQKSDSVNIAFALGTKEPTDILAI